MLFLCAKLCNIYLEASSSTVSFFEVLIEYFTAKKNGNSSTKIWNKYNDLFESSSLVHVSET